MLSDEEDSQESQSSQDEFEFEVSQRCTSTPKSDTINLSLPRKGLFSGPAADLACRLGVSNRKQVALTAQLIKMGGGSLDDATVSTSSAWRERTSATSTRTKEIKAAFGASVPRYIVLHWDGKIIHYQTEEPDDRLAVKASYKAD